MGVIKELADKGHSVVIASEEPDHIWMTRFHRLGVDRESVGVYQLDHFSEMGEESWGNMIKRMAQSCIEERRSLAVVDTIAGLGPIRDENDAPQVTRAIRPLGAIAKTGASVLIIHHTRKPGEKGGGWAGGANIRGSGAFAGAVDIIAELVPWSQSTGDRRRRLRIKGRPHDANCERCLQIDKLGRISTIESAAEVGDDAIYLSVNELLYKAGEDGLTVQGMLDRFNDGRANTISRSTLDRALKPAEEKGQIVRSGSGTRGDPHILRHPDFVPSHTGGDME